MLRHVPLASPSHYNKEFAQNIRASRYFNASAPHPAPDESQPHGGENRRRLVREPFISPPYVGLDIKLTKGKKELVQPAQSEQLAPRYLRRQAHQDTSASTDSAGSATATRPHNRLPPRLSDQDWDYRSLKYDPPVETSRKLRLLEPYTFSARIKKACALGSLEEAIAHLKYSPRDAQNTPVWNTLIWECLKAGRYQLAYKLFTDMKRRGFSPTTRTFQTMFSGLTRIKTWATHPKQLENARSLYEAYYRHMASVKRDESAKSELSVLPLASYLKILGEAGKLQDMFDVYEAMDSEGPLAPNEFIYTTLFQALAMNNRGSNQIESAADARLLWSEMRKASKKLNFPLDSHVVSSAITALSSGSAADQELAFSIVSEYFGLKEGPTVVPSSSKLPLQAQSLSAALHLCNLSGKHKLCIEYFEQVKKRPSVLGGAQILDRGHTEEVLRAGLALPSIPGSAERAVAILEWMLRQEAMGASGPHIRPLLSTFNLVMMSCWRAVDWNSAMRTFDLMTGYHAHDFRDGAVLEQPMFTKRSAGRNILPTAEFMSSMVKTAFASKDRPNMRQALRIVDHLGFDQLLYTGEGRDDETTSARKNREFYVAKLVPAIVNTVEHVLNSDAGRRQASEQEAKRWTALASRARKFVPSVAPDTKSIDSNNGFTSLSM